MDSQTSALGLCQACNSASKSEVCDYTPEAAQATPGKIAEAPNHGPWPWASRSVYARTQPEPTKPAPESRLCTEQAVLVTASASWQRHSQLGTGRIARRTAESVSRWELVGGAPTMNLCHMKSKASAKLASEISYRSPASRSTCADEFL